MRKVSYNLCKTLIVLGVAAAGSAAAMGPMGLSEKPGLWQMSTSMPRMPHGMVSKICVDAAMTDRLVDSSAHVQGVTCSKRDVHMRPGGAVVDTVCTTGGRTITTHAEINMPTPASFHETVQASFSPAIAGHSQQSSTVDGQWLGQCPAGMRAGDVVMGGMPGMAGGMKLNMYDVTKAMHH